MDHTKLLKVATRMLFDLVTVLEKKETDYEIGCKCKDTDVAQALHKLLANSLQDCPVSVIIKEEMIVVAVPATLPSSPEALPPLPPSQTP